MILLLVAFAGQLLIWGVFQFLLTFLIWEGYRIEVLVPLHILWFWINFYIHIRLNAKLAIRSLKNVRWDKDGTLDPYIKKVRMYIRTALIRRSIHG